MKAVKEFNEFIQENIVKRQSPDTSRARFLMQEAKKSHRALQKRVEIMGIDDDSANSIVKDCYDIVMELIRSHMLMKGYNAKGQGAHSAEVSYMRVLEFKEKDVQLANTLQYHRNGMIYYGQIVDKEYAEEIFEFTTKAYNRLATNQDIKE